jgi:cellobiose-specific phosphotransferase system component IIA
MMTKGSQIYPITKVVCVVLFAIGGLILINVPTFGFASSSSGADQSAAKMHLDEAIKALQAGDTSGAKVHMTEADKVIQEGAAKMHLDEAIKALESGDTAGAETHAQMAQDSL